MKNINIGDYVLATKYHDGSPYDQWAVGFYNSCDRDRYFVIDDSARKPHGLPWG